jgi:hypothetical protein
MLRDKAQLTDADVLVSWIQRYLERAAEAVYFTKLTYDATAHGLYYCGNPAASAMLSTSRTSVGRDRQKTRSPPARLLVNWGYSPAARPGISMHGRDLDNVIAIEG